MIPPSNSTMFGALHRFFSPLHHRDSALEAREPRRVRLAHVGDRMPNDSNDRGHELVKPIPRGVGDRRKKTGG